MAAAYAALVSLSQIIHQILHPPPPHHFLIPTEQIQSLQDHVNGFIDFLEKYSTPETEDLEKRIVGAAYEAEDIIESYVVSQIQAKYESNLEIKGSTLSCLSMKKGISPIHKVLKKRTVLKLIKKFISIGEKVETIRIRKGVKDMGPDNTTAASSSRSVPGGKNLMIGFDEHLIQVKTALATDEFDLQIIPVVGMGGIGKTTLATHVYKDAYIVERFDFRAWVSVSLEYNLREIIVSLLQQINSNIEVKGLSADLIGNLLYKELFGRRYFVVLDDMWDIQAWDLLKTYLPNNRNGSRILVTTRLLNLAEDIKSCALYELALLDNESSWALMLEVFGKENFPLDELEEIGISIARKCRGLPLALVVIGRLLAKSEKTRDFWEYVEQNVTSTANDENDQQCMKVLRLSYIQLPVYLKPCFLYLAVFPKNVEIRTSRLIRLWVAEGFIKPASGKTLEEVAEGYLEDLFDRNLVMVKKQGLTGKVKTCSIHDLIRDLCTREVGRDKFLCIPKLENPIISSHMRRERRLSIHIGTANKKGHEVLRSATLNRSFLSYSKWESRRCIARRLNLLRILDVVDFYSMEEILRLFNSRYITCSIPWELQAVSSMISLLWNLQTLVVPGNVSLPSEFWKMPQLRHLKMPGITLPDPPEDQGESQSIIVLQNLQTLSTIKDFVFREQILQRIPNLKKMGIRCDAIEKIGSFCLSKLASLKKLESLVLAFRGSRENMAFSSSLKKLSLSYCQIPWEDMSVVGLLPNLEVLKLQTRAAKGQMWNPNSDEFCRLKFLLIDGCEMETWVADDGHFPCLEHLHLVNMKIEEIPIEFAEILTLQTINLNYCNRSLFASAKRISEERESIGYEEVQVRSFPSEGVGRFVRWFEQATAREEEEKGRYAEQLTAARAKLRKANVEVKAVRAEFAAQLSKISEAEVAAEIARGNVKRLGAELRAARGELKTASDGQDEVLRAYTRRLLLSEHFSELANELVGLINGNAAVDALEEVAKDFPALEASKYGYERLEGATLLSRYAEVIRGHLGRFPLLNELASSPELLTAEQIAACSTDRDSELDAAFEALPDETEEEELEQEQEQEQQDEAGGEGPKEAGAEVAAEGPHSGQEKEAPELKKENVVGLEDEAERLIGYLTKDTMELEVSSIIGMPGIGKTTLAWKVFHDPAIQYEFPVRIWIYVSQEFAMKDIFISILKQFTMIIDRTIRKADEELAVLVRDYLSNEKFLLVMDDIWSCEDWDRLNFALPTSNKRGKVLITSRREEVGWHVNRRRGPHMMCFLTLEESFELLQLEAFGRPECPPELEAEGRLIAQRCRGLPLAIVVIAGILHKYFIASSEMSATKKAWGEVSDILSTYHDSDPSTCMEQIISLSYKNLPYHLRKCFLYMGMFPQDYEIPAWRLVRLWIAEGFIQQNEEISLEETAENHLEDLISRNLVRAEKLKVNGKVKTCRIHDQLRDFCKTEAGGVEENFFQEIKMSSDGGGFQPSLSEELKYHRLCIHSNVLSFVSRKPYGPSVHTFTCYAKEETTMPLDDISAIPTGFKQLRVLDVKPIRFTGIPSDMSRLLHLRYLVLTVHYLNVLPSAFSNLWNIETLVVYTDAGTLKIRADILNMIQLRHFKTNASAALLKTSKSSEGAGEKIQTLETISPGSCTADVFDRARNLKKLGVRGRLAMLLDEKSGSFGSLGSLENLENLKLIHTMFYDSRMEGRLHCLPPAYKFPPKLKILTLYNTLLDWRHMSILGSLDKLEVLKLKVDAFTGQTWEATDGGFRHLEVLHIGKTNLKIWLASRHHFPRLKHLQLNKCEDLQQVPIELADVPSFQKLDLYGAERAAASANRIEEKIKENNQQPGNVVRRFRLSIRG